jgi:hypothetical protein
MVQVNEMVLQVCPMCSTEYPMEKFRTVDIRVGWKGNIVHLCENCAKKLLELDSFPRFK